MIKTEINVTDEISPLFTDFLRSHTSYMGTLGKSIGYWFQKQTKRDVFEGAPGGEAFKERWSYEKRKKLNPKALENWYGRLNSKPAGRGGSAIGYEYKNGAVYIGWLSNSAARIGNLQENGFSRVVTDAMRRFFASRGFNISEDTTQIKVPARPIFVPMTNYLAPKLPPYITEKLNLYMQGKVQKSKRNPRKYKVYR